MELCYRWARNESINARSLYITSEADEDWACEKARSYGWERASQYFVPGSLHPKKLPSSGVTIWQTTDFATYLEPVRQRSPLLELLLCGQMPFGLPKDTMKDAVDIIYQKLDELELRKRIKIPRPDVLILDSVNTLRAERRYEVFAKFMNIALAGPRIMIMILDTTSHDESHEFWSYVADMVIRLGRRRMLDYTTRTIEIVKARYQAHVEGEHQLKIYPPSSYDVSDSRRRRAHPHRSEGGIFIYPSIHYYLSVYKRSGPEVMSEPFSISRGAADKLQHLDGLLHGGFPRGRCTGFVGIRGGHKSHLGYVGLLSSLVDAQANPGAGKNRALVISLREDEGLARSTMNKILKEQYPYSQLTIEKLEAEGQIEILYYPPGFITPEEFFHRMFMMVQRMKQGGGHLSLLFNSLDQLSARFPLCAEQRSFIPGIIQTLTAEEVTSFFIAVDEPGQPEQQYGLLAMADAILSFEHQVLPSDVYESAVKKRWGKSVIDGLQEPSIAEALQESREAGWPMQPFHRTVVLRVVRYAGGQAAGGGGILELVDDESLLLGLYGEKGLYFTPFSPEEAQREARAATVARHDPRFAGVLHPTRHADQGGAV